MLISPQNIANPSRKSGYDRVYFDPQRSARHYRAILDGTHAAVKRGPRRATALEAAWDWCNHINGLGVQPAQRLKSAGHPSKPRTKAQVQAARKAQAKAVKDRKGFVYLLGEEGDDTYVKIGESEDHPRYRLRALQTGNPRKLILLGFLQCSDRLATEQQLHQKHIKLNHLQEWFRKSPAILQEFPQTQKTGV